MQLENDVAQTPFFDSHLLLLILNLNLSVQVLAKHRISCIVFVMNLICGLCCAVVEDFDDNILVTHLDVKASLLL